jgi:DNA-binding SARP family transcriptional activator/tetratricopeptide (TPR) repeat protein
VFVCLLGSPHILIDQKPLEGLRRKNRALLYYLAAQREGVQGGLTRERLLAFFWPDLERPAAQQVLRTMLHDLRSRLGADCLQTVGDRLALAPAVQVDARQLEAALADPAPGIPTLAAALQLYRGDFLEGFNLNDTPAFDEWLLAEREAYRAQAMRGWGRLAQLHEAGGDLPAARAALTRALAVDPLREDIQRESLRLRCLSGDRAGAIRQYEALRKGLDEELGVPPMPETRALYDAIVTDHLAAAPVSAPEIVLRSPAAARPQRAVELLPFTGRERELAALFGFIGAGRLVLVEGDPGIGKTRLVDEFLAAGYGRGRRAALVLRGVAHELEQGLPYQPVADALRGLLAQPSWPSLLAGLALDPVWLAELARLLPELHAHFPDIPAVPPQMDESRLWHALSQLLLALARQQAVVLLLEDLHWADASSLGLLGYLARRSASPDLLLIGTTRPVEPHARLSLLARSLAHEDRLADIRLVPLSPEDTRAVARRFSPAHAEALSRWLASSADGNPYFITELIRYALQTDVLHKDGTFASDPLATQLLPPTIQNLILSRLIRLSQDARRVLDAAAVIGREFDFQLLYRVLALVDGNFSEPDLLGALDELQAAVLIRPGGGEHFSFDHSLTLDVVRQDMGELRARLLHRQAARALEQLHAARIHPIAGRISQHYLQGGLPQRAAEYAFTAGQFAAGLAAWVEAIAFFEQARAAQSDPGQTAATSIALGTARFHKGDFALASQAFRAAIELARAHGDLALLEAAYMGLNLSLLPQSRYAEAIAAGRELTQSGPPELQICAHFIWASGLSVESAHPDEAEAHLLEVTRLLEANPGYAGQVTRAHVSYQLAGVVGQHGQTARAVELYQQALALSRENEAALDLLRRIMLYNNLAYHLNLLGDPSAAEFARAGIQLARERGSLTHLPYLLSTSGEIALSQGDLDGAEAFFSEGLRLAEEGQFAERIAGLSANLGLVARRRGLDELARQRLSAALALADRLGTRHLAVRIRLWLAPLLPPAEARARLQEAQEIALNSGFQSLFEEISQLEQKIA